MLRAALLLCASVCALPLLAADSDADGVVNGQDDCASTPRTALVNARGCHFAQAGGLFSVSFEPGSAWVDAEQILALRSVAKQLNDWRQDFPGLQIAIRGFRGDQSDNSKAEQLSLLRAKAVWRQLKQARFPEEAMRLEALGRAVVAGDQSTARRVDILLLPWAPPPPQ